MTSLSENGREEFPLSEKGYDLAERNALSEYLPEVPASGAEAKVSRKHQGGRPRKPPSERRTHKYLVSANDAEAEAIKAAATASGLKPAAYLRAAGTGAKLSKRRDEVLYHRLSRLGVRIQQLARRAGADGRAEERDALEALIREVIDVRANL